MDSIWQKVKSAIKEKIPAHCFKMWIESLEPKSFNESTAVLTCPNSFSRKRVQDHYRDLIEAEISKLSKRSCRLIIEISERNGDSKPSGSDFTDQLPLPNAHVQPHYGRLLRRDFTFDQFVVGGNNDFAYSASLSLASGKNSHQNCLFLLSQTGMGKSHLSQAVGHHILSESPSDRVYYVTSEDFTNEMVFALRNNSIENFKEKYRKHCDVLLLEDIHFLTGKERTQMELALTLDCLLNADKKLIFTSCYPPSEIPKMSDQLRSRLSGGLISNIDPPNFRTRVRILQKKSKQNGYELPEEVTDYLAGELSENVRQLESGLIGVAAKSSLLGIPVDLGLAESVVKNIVRLSKNITIDVIKKLVCKHYNVSLNDLMSNSRKQSIVRPRQLGIYLSRKFTDSPLQAIGRSFNRYHATALYAINAVERELREKGPLQKQVQFLSLKLESGKF